MGDVIRNWWKSLIRRPEGPGVGVYIFGKHPAFADFIDVAKLPGVPGEFRFVHEKLRPVIEAAYSSPDAVDRLLIWTGRGRSSVLLVHPSRDGRRTASGPGRLSPLLVGLSAQCDAVTVYSFVRERFPALIESLVGASATEVTDRLSGAASEWVAAFPAAADAAADAAASDDHWTEAAAEGSIYDRVIDLPPPGVAVLTPTTTYHCRLSLEELADEPLSQALTG